jgi:hypothetical protein
MGIRVILVAGVLGLTVVTVTLARQQPGDPAKLDQKLPDGQPQAGLATAAALRAQVATLRAQVELLELEHEVNKTVLLEALKVQRQAGSEAERAAMATEMTSALLRAARLGKTFDDFRQQFGDENGMQREAEKAVKEQADKDRADNDGKKKEFVRQATELHEKKFALVDLEKQLGNLK